MSASTHPAPVPIRPPAKPSPGPVPMPPSVQPKPPRRWLLPAGLALMGLLGGALYLMLKPSQATKTGSTDLVRTARATAGTLDRIVRVAGQTSARNYATVMVPTFRGPDSGRDLTLTKLAAAGTFVRKGDVVAELDAQTLRDHIDDVEDQVQQAENNVEKKKAEQDVERESMEQNLRVAKSTLDKANLDLSAGEVKTEIEQELLKLSASEADAAYKQLQRDVSFKNTADAAELKILDIAVQQQHIHLGNHQTDLTRFVMKTPMDGLVVMTQIFRQGQNTQVQLGDNVRPGQPFMKVVDTNSMQVEALVSQADSSEFRIGQEATIGLDAFPGLQFRGKIYSIGALAVKGMWDTYYIRNVPVRISIEGHDPRLIPDLSAWAHVRLGAGESNTIIVPREAVGTEHGQDFVYVKGQKGFVKRPVELGLKTSTQVAIKSGLKAGEEVAVGSVY
jgi:HlyD family secretion protein